MEEESWRNHGGIIEEESWGWRKHRGGIMGVEESLRRNHGGGGIIGEES